METVKRNIVSIEEKNMGTQENDKKVLIYFYYLAITRQKESSDTSTYDIAQITNVFSKMLEYTLKKSLKDRRQELTFAEKVVWLDSFEDMGNGNYNITFKSAKYNHVRNEINTETMEPLGTRKQRRDGDEEKTHLCIRLAQGQQRYLAVHESNYYGITINCIVNYLNECFKRFNEETEEQYHYEVSYEIMPGDDFLTSLKEAKTISALTLTVYKDSLPNEFMLFAGRTSDIADDVEIKIKTPKKGGKFPDNLIKAYYEAMQGDGRIKRIKASGSKKHGSFEASTDLIKMKNFISVGRLSTTDEVDSNDFFNKAQEFIETNRR